MENNKGIFVNNFDINKYPKLQEAGIKDVNVVIGDMSISEIHPRPIINNNLRVILDDDGYFTGNYCTIGNIARSIDVDSLPPTLNPSVDACFKYNHSKVDIDDEWILDEDKFLELYKSWNKHS